MGPIEAPSEGCLIVVIIGVLALLIGGGWLIYYLINHLQITWSSYGRP
jgi:hypothetical protein